MLQKQNKNISFSSGVDTKTDPWQVPLGAFLSLVNIVFTKDGLLQKRNGYAPLTPLPVAASYLTTFNGDLTGIGTTFQALSDATKTWVNKGNFQPCSVSTLPVIRNNVNQTQQDMAISPNGLLCVAYTESNAGTLTSKYAVLDSTTGQNILAPALLPSASTTNVTPRVFLLGNYFVIVYSATISAASHLEYIAINTTSLTVTANADISTDYSSSQAGNFDGAIFNGLLYLAWGTTSGSPHIKLTTLNEQLTLGSTGNLTGSTAPSQMSVTISVLNNTVWLTYISSTKILVAAVSTNNVGGIILPETDTTITGTPLNVTSISLQSGALNTVTVYYEIANNYSYDSGVQSHFINLLTVRSTGVVSGKTTVARSVGLASKVAVIGNNRYVLTAYQSPYQNTYFLYNLVAGRVVAKLAYENAGGYLNFLPNLLVNGNVLSCGYLYKDLIEAVNKNTNVPSGSQVAGIYSQTGINYATFNLAAGTESVEIGNNLNLTGGFLWAYDGYLPVEQNFFLYPDSIESPSNATTGGFLAAQIYFYQVTYEWTDNQGNAFRSAPSIPIEVDLSASMTATNTITVDGPNLRLTYKIANPVKIVIYRWSTAQQNYYQVTSIASPLLNVTTADSWTFTDTLADATILGNNLLYTTGGVVEDIGPPAFSNQFLFDDRLWGISSEDPNLLWYSKQIIEATPVEMSDLFTMYIAPSLGAQGPSGALLCGFPMDDKAVLFKSASLAYFNGTGPDNTGANSQYSPPILITSTLGCSSQKSIVFMPKGLMFEFASEAGNQIWLLGRDLSTDYIGAPVESFTTSATVQSAVNIPGTNQVRFTLSSGITLMYDYYYGRWGTFQGVPAVSSTLYQGLHTYINSSGQAFQESPGEYLDGSNPVLISFLTGWLNLAGLQGYIRSYWFYLLGKYISPHKLMCNIAYDYNPSPAQGSLISPTNFTPVYGGTESNGQTTVYGQDTPYGGPGNVENWRVFLDRQRCSAFQISVQEIFDASFGVTPGAGLTLSGINLVYAGKSGWRPISAAHDVGGQPE